MIPTLVCGGFISVNIAMLQSPYRISFGVGDWFGLISVSISISKDYMLFCSLFSHKDTLKHLFMHAERLLRDILKCFCTVLFSFSNFYALIGA